MLTEGVPEIETEPLIGCVVAVASTRRAPAVVNDSGSVWPLVYRGEEVVTAPMCRLPVWPLVVLACAALVG